MKFHAKTVVRGAGIVMLFTLILGLFTFFTKIILTRLYTPEEVGLFFAVIALIGTISLFKDFGMNQAVQKFIPEYVTHKRIKNIQFISWFNVIFSIITSLVIGGIIILLSDFLATKYFENQLAKPLIIIMVLWLALSKLKLVFLQIQFAYSKILSSQIIRAIESISILALLPLLAFAGLQGAAWAYVIGVGLALLYAIFTSPKLCFEKVQPWDGKEAKRFMKFSLPLMFSELMAKPAKTFDILFLTYLRPLSEVGVFSVVYWLPMNLTRVASAFSKMMLPTTAEYVARNMRKQLNRNLQKLYTYLLWVLTPAILIFVIFAKEILLVLYGAEYVSGVLVVQLIATGVIFHSISIVNLSVISGSGHSKAVAKVTILSSVANVVLNLIFIPLYGMVGAGITTLIQYVGLFFYAQYQVNKTVQISFPWKKLSIILVAGALFWVTSKLIPVLDWSLWLSIPFVILIGGSIYLGVTFFAKVVTWKEIMYMKDMILKK